MRRYLVALAVLCALVGSPALAETPQGSETVASCVPEAIDLTAPDLQALLEGARFTPVGEGEVVFLAETNTKISTQEYEIVDRFGTVTRAAVSCSGSCTGNNCVVQGCDKDGAGGCTGCNCDQQGSHACSQCTCTKTVTSTTVD